MLADEAAHQRQSDTEPALRAAVRPVHLREHVEHRRQLVGRDADAVIANRHHRTVALLPGAERDPTSRVRVFRSVGEQVGEDLRQADGVAVNGDGCAGQIQHQLVAGAVEPPARIHGRVDHEREMPERDR